MVGENRPSLESVISHIQAGLNDDDVSVRLHSAKLLEELGRSMSRESECETTATSGSLLPTEKVLIKYRMVDAIH